MKLPIKYEEVHHSVRKEAREQYVKEQGGYCWYCKMPLKDEPPSGILKKRLDLDLFPPNFLSNPIHLQHDHQTGWTEGAVHAYCNGVMWQYEGR